MRALIRCLAFLVIVVPPGAAQDLTAGVSVGVVKLSDTRSEQALSGVLAYQAGWLSLYAVPAILHVSNTATQSTVSSSGLGDLPLIAAASYTSPAPASPSVGASLAVVLPTGNASCGLGSGQTAAGVDVGAGVSPGRAHLWGDASRSITGVSSQSSLNAPKATTLHFEAGYEVTPGWTWTGSVGVDVGTADSTHPLSRVIGLGVSHPLARTAHAHRRWPSPAHDRVAAVGTHGWLGDSLLRLLPGDSYYPVAAHRDDVPDGHGEQDCQLSLAWDLGSADPLGLAGADVRPIDCNADTIVSVYAGRDGSWTGLPFTSRHRRSSIARARFYRPPLECPERSQYSS